MKKTYTKPSVYAEQLSLSPMMLTCDNNVTGPETGVGGDVLIGGKFECEIDLTDPENADFCYNLPLDAGYFSS